MAFVASDDLLISICSSRYRTVEKEVSKGMRVITYRCPYVSIPIRKPLRNVLEIDLYIF